MTHAINFKAALINQQNKATRFPDKLQKKNPPPYIQTAEIIYPIQYIAPPMRRTLHYLSEQLCASREKIIPVPCVHRPAYISVYLPRRPLCKRYSWRWLFAQGRTRHIELQERVYVCMYKRATAALQQQRRRYIYIYTRLGERAAMFLGMFRSAASS